MIRRLYYVACDLCLRRCPGTEQTTVRATRRAANTAGWHKRGGIRACPDCRATLPALNTCDDKTET